MKHIIFLSLALFFTFSSAQASLIHIKDGLFVEDGVTVNFPCSQGGEPLVIYSTPINNKSPISSKEIIFPLYIKNNFIADPLLIDATIQSKQISLSDLIIANDNPAFEDNYIRFNLQHLNQTEFFVNTVNFAAINVQPKDHFVSSVKVFLNNKLFFATATPVRMHDFDQDWGAIVMKKTKQVAGMQYSWNQLGEWKDTTSHYPVKYHFTVLPQKDNPGSYNGFGFWICGAEKQPKMILPLSKTLFRDVLNAN